ncbi:cysteine--tRNA ligase [Sphingomonas sp. CGMCC 1.13654]|uniref:Cysteine--tRNA ligase n=1 Tax=Sphingomonas chungangi TaxID=2683589 RepID=A0A838L970_9SPHN|nr:cysteine--tRNA ligase [Sphingomonas chungangi]MBA2935567.1 cysteine--tRNA ligase [Sphingomonas chungangi]MVW54259.1 cysteine--tRNA ligase [Sphingomonas chungangi]
MTQTGAPLTLFNSLTREIEEFRPIDPKMVRLYSCGPTVYSTAHLGNLRAYVFTDTLRRVLNWKGYATTHVINITDVGHLTSDADAGDDKMEVAAQKAGITIWDVAARYTQLFKGDLKALGILDPSLWSVATDHVQDMIAFAQVLEDRGATYELDGGLYFDVTKVPDYGRLAGHQTGPEVGRIEAVEGKRHPADFAIWRKSAPGENRQMEWLSPWGPGAPGWHLECSVMSIKYLGEQFDIHTGGIDHREIHHCNEIAQNQAFNDTARTGANVWMHNNFLVDRTGKMSKSKGGVATLGALVARGVHPLAYRLLCLGAHYRSELEFSLDAVAAALTRLKRLVIAIATLKAEATLDETLIRPAREAGFGKGASLDWQRKSLEDGLSGPALAFVGRFDAALSGDLMTPQALPTLDAVLTSDLSTQEKLRLVASFDLALGLGLLALDRRALSVRPEGVDLADADVEALLDQRQQARATKDFASADAARDQIKAAGVEIMDGDPLRWEWRPQLSD